MAYKLNPEAWSAVFAVPSSVVDEHLRKVGGQQLKVLLYLLRWNGKSPNLEQMAKEIGLSVEDTKDALSYWIETGYLYRDGEELNALPPVMDGRRHYGDGTPSTESAAYAETPPVFTEIPDVPPTHETVAARILESPEIKALFNEAQILLGKTIGYDTQAKLLMMVDAYGLPPEVVLTIMEYAVSHGKNSISYICKVGKNWAEDGITSLEAAEERLHSLEQEEKLWKSFVSLFSVDPPKATTTRVAYLKKWRVSWNQSNELIFLAYEQMIDKINKINFNYLDKILAHWHEEGWRTPKTVLQQAEAEKKRAPEAGRKAGTAAARQVSYDSEAYKKKARGPIEYKRRDK